MKHRFRYLDERGQQVEVDDLASLREHVQSGQVDDQTLLYDALTDEWAPAEGHPAYRLLDDPVSPPEVDDAPASGIPAKKPVADLTDELDFPELDITLAPTREIDSAEEAVEKLLREREKDRRDGIETRADETIPPVEEPAVPMAAPRAEPSPAVSDRPKGPSLPAPGDEPIRVRRRPTPNRPPSRRPAAAQTTRSVALPKRVLAVVAIVVVAFVGYGVSRWMDTSATAEAATEPAGPEGQVLTSGRTAWSDAEGGAFTDMIEGVDSLRQAHGVQRIPGAWLAGHYLSDAGAHPDVQGYWNNYLRFVEAVRSQDTALFRRSFVSRLQEENVSGPIVSIRLARALETFRESQPARDTVYERMEDLAESSLDLHDLLLERTEDIVYDPITEERASRQPILEAWSDDPYLRETIWALLDRITANLALLEYDTGSGRSDVTERLFQELRNRSTTPGGGG